MRLKAEELDFNRTLCREREFGQLHFYVVLLPALLHLLLEFLQWKQREVRKEEQMFFGLLFTGRLLYTVL